jgi:hypothetical protein
MIVASPTAGGSEAGETVVECGRDQCLTETLIGPIGRELLSTVQIGKQFLRRRMDTLRIIRRPHFGCGKRSADALFADRPQYHDDVSLGKKVSSPNVQDTAGSDKFIDEFIGWLGCNTKKRR